MSVCVCVLLFSGVCACVCACLLYAYVGVCVCDSESFVLGWRVYVRIWLRAIMPVCLYIYSQMQNM